MQINDESTFNRTCCEIMGDFIRQFPRIVDIRENPTQKKRL